ncbi:PREDICTED: putative late blight resistance protein homolog R1B-14 [Ipomoea nil]|uniref:putative late blight resistance protein homolog R1B-14 n=1 Tax=Ipomoea nil TaxID=35883 RepID=UPI0009014323|nr:PREDICTED: putative late blight resistance protein homolog R1B-14 [Ipomoea nil]
MPGLGKTTLANKVFKDAKVKDYFFNCAWVYVSKVCTRKNIFLQLFTELIKNSKSLPDNMNNQDSGRMSDKDILEKIKGILGSNNYFIVIDDVWTKEQWNELKTAFPKNKGSRVLVSTRDNVVARLADSKRNPHTLKFLTEDESWELLQKQVYGEESCPDKFKELHGRSIAKNSDGLPLAILTMADKLKTSAAWDQVAEAKTDFFKTELNSHEDLIRVSYNPLPYDLKSCFLYFGAFPKGYEISSEKLIRLWIAEGFIGEEAGGLTLEETAQEKLSILVNKNLVMATQTKLNGQPKTCRVHNMLHEFCKNEIKDENIFEENINQIQTKQLESCRRLGVQCDVAEFFSTCQAAEKVRSLLCFYSDKYELPEDKVPLIRKAFPLLRVLHTIPGEYIILTRFPKNVAKFQLFHLRYIAISTTLNILPQAIDSLWNMQTLIVWTTQSTLYIKGDIWQMTQLRHLQSNSPAQLLPPSPSKKTKKLPSVNRNLQTLSRISPESCTAAALANAPNLNKLAIQGNLVKLFETNKDTGSSLFKNLGELKKLEKLKLLNHGGKLQCLSEFPGKIRKLTLSNTQLEWSELSVLESLDQLEILKLIENAFKGHEWAPSRDGFSRLQFLRIDETDLESLKASNLHFPLLKTLILRQCLMLVEVPPSFADIDSLQEMELNHTNSGAEQSAQSIFQIKQKKEKELKEKGGSPQRFNLRIITESSN